MIIETMTPAEACDLLRQAGIKTSPERIRAGIEQGVYPWGECVRTFSGNPTYTVYAKLLRGWMEARAE